MLNKTTILILVLHIAAPSIPQTRHMTVKDLLALPPCRADFTIPYGSDPNQLGELRLPSSKGPHPVVIVIHGGCWLAEYDLHHIGPLAGHITKLGYATWSLEYRRVGNPGGGWPGTFTDIADGIDFIKNLASTHDLDLQRVIAIGHSAGGHLALWAAARPELPENSPLYRTDPLSFKGVIALAGVGDLTNLEVQEGCGKAAQSLMGGSPSEFPERYAQASPQHLLPFYVPQILIHGQQDPIIALAASQNFYARARELGDSCRLVVLPEAAHFEPVIPSSPAWKEVRAAIQSLLQ
jgi:acetyl esterase/lipase